MRKEYNIIIVIRITQTPYVNLTPYVTPAQNTITIHPNPITFHQHTRTKAKHEPIYYSRHHTSTIHSDKTCGVRIPVLGYWEEKEEWGMRGEMIIGREERRMRRRR
jgi:hypothetical protein